MLPDFGPGGLAYTPSDLEGLSHLQQAASLAPDVPAAHFYLGRFLAGHRKPGARAELERARQSGDPAISAEVNRFEKTIP